MSLVGLLFMIPLRVRAVELEKFERARAANRRILTECVDLRAQWSRDRRMSHAYAASFRLFLNAHLTDGDLRRGISPGLAAAGTEGDRTVFIFYRTVALAELPRQADRVDHRQRLSDLARAWRAESRVNEGHRFVIRFEDECEIPVPEWK